MKKLSTLLLLSAALSACNGNSNRQQTDNDTSATVTKVPPNPCTDPAAMEKIRETISVGSVTGMTEEEEKEWLTKTDKLQPGESGITDYSVDTFFMEHCILSVDCFAESMGAYPDSWHTYLNFDMRTGDSLFLSAIMDNAKRSEFIKLANVKLQQQIEDARKTLTGEDLEIFNQTLTSREANPNFSPDYMGQYFIKENTLTLVFPFEFPHVIRALEPDGNITFSIGELQPFLKKDGPLGYWVK